MVTKAAETKQHLYMLFVFRKKLLILIFLLSSIYCADRLTNILLYIISKF